MSSASLLHVSTDNGVGIGFEQQNFLSGVDDDEMEIQSAKSQRREPCGSGTVGTLRICACKRGRDDPSVHVEGSGAGDVSLTVQNHLSDIGDRTRVNDFPDQIRRKGRFRSGGLPD